MTVRCWHACSTSRVPSTPRYRLGLPHAGTWREVLNSDADIYNGSGIGNYGAVEATDEPWHGRPASAVMVLPPLAALWFEPA